MAIYKSAENMTVNVRNTDIVACETYSEVAEQVIIETMNGDLTLNSADMITLQGGIPDTYAERNSSESQSDNLKKFLVHFRRPSTYQGEFGFDWLRDQYVYPIVTVGGTTKELSLDTNKLKDEYRKNVLNPITPYGNDYYCSWLNLLKNQEVDLDIEVEEIEQLDPTDNTEIIFESSNPDLIEIVPDKLPLKDLISGGLIIKNLGGNDIRNYYSAANLVKIKNKGLLNQNCQIKVFAELNKKKEEVGKLMAIKNDEESKYTINIYVIKSYLVRDAVFGESVIDNKINSIGGLSAIEEHLNKKSLNQASVQVKLMYNPDTNLPYDWGFRRVSLINASKEVRYKDMIDENTMEVKNTGIYMNYINDRFKLMFPSLVSKKGIFLYLTSLKDPGAGGAAFTVPLENKHCIIFNTNLDHLSSYAHELAHTLGLSHSFPDSTLTNDQEIAETQIKLNNERTKKTNHLTNYAAYYAANPQKKREVEGIFDAKIKYFKERLVVLRKNPHKFIQDKTDNIMDYNLSNQLSLFKWQWEVIRDEAKSYYH